MSWNTVSVQRSLAARGDKICWVQPGENGTGDFIRCVNQLGTQVLFTPAGLGGMAYSITNLLTTKNGVCWQDARGHAWCHRFGGTSSQIGIGAQVQGAGVGTTFIAWLDAASGSISTTGTLSLGGTFSQSQLAGFGDYRICASALDDPYSIQCLPSFSFPDSNVVATATLPYIPSDLQVSTFTALWNSADGDFGGWGFQCYSGSTICTNPPDFGLLDFPVATFTKLAFSDAIACGVDTTTLSCWGSVTQVFDMQGLITSFSELSVLDVAPYTGSISAGVCVQLESSILCSSTGDLPLLSLPFSVREPGTSIPCGIDYISSRSTCFYCPLGSELVPSGSLLTCEKCPAGYVRGVNDSACVQCGSFAYANASQTECLSCPDGALWSGPPGSCSQCPPGSQSYNNTDCDICPPGLVKNASSFSCFSCSRFSGPSNDQTQCLSCTAPYIYSYSTPSPPPFFADGFCARCPNGQEPAFWAPTGCTTCVGASIRSNTMALCQPCQAGFTSAASHTLCQPCADGYARGTTDFDCYLCPSGYTPNAGQTQCLLATRPYAVPPWKFIFYCIGTCFICSALLFRQEASKPLFFFLLTIGIGFMLVGALGQPNQQGESVNQIKIA